MTDKNMVTLFDIEEDKEPGSAINEQVSSPGDDLDDLIDTVASKETKAAEEQKKTKEAPADKTRIVCYCGQKHTYEDRSLTLDDIRKDLQKKYYPELTKDRTEMDYQEKTGLIFPRVKAAKKGSGRKHFLSALEAVKNPGKVVSILAARNGIYEVRRNEIGVFSAKTGYVYDLDPWQEGFRPFLPLIPFSLLCTTIAFMKSMDTECLVQFFWNREERRYFIHCPEQKVTQSSVDAMRDGPEREHLLVMDLHSHNRMKAKFSTTDNVDEKETRLFGIVGKTEGFFPEIRVRISVGGNYHEIDPESIFESPFKTFPEEWSEMLKEGKEECCV